MKYLILILLSAFVASCRNEYDPESVAERFCNCMKKNGAINDFNNVADKCGEDLKSNNRYMKLWLVDMRDYELDKKVSDETRDSVKLFFDRFTDYTKTNCCKEVLSCPDSTELK